MVQKVLIANRSEVALRIQATCHARGIQTIAVYSPEDACSRFVTSASEAYPLKKSGAQAYFDGDAIIAIALAAGADAIHPGYGFLAENYTFAQKVIDAGLVWIGPTPKSMALMADKISARNLMDYVGVPTVPAVMLDMQVSSVDAAREAARVLGYPVMIKDPKSGGGKAMRRVMSDEVCLDAIQAVLAEARRLTGSTTLLIEKYITQARHVEVQVAGDGTNFIHLYERDCSVQRRHQKIIEEAPCVSVSQATLDLMYQTAITAARAACYDSIGTVEFIVTSDSCHSGLGSGIHSTSFSEQFYFLEMNTRLQVEHGVTELTTGVDLVGLQFDLATRGASVNKKFLPSQSSIMRTGHAIQARLYAENPETNFTPSTGTLNIVSFPHAPWTRIEHDLAPGQEITPFFDPMIAKVMAWGGDRNQCIARLQHTLASIVMTGIVTNRALLYTLLGTVEFCDGEFYTGTLGERGYLEEMLNGSRAPHCKAQGPQDDKNGKIFVVSKNVLDDKKIVQDDFLSSWGPKNEGTRDPLSGDFSFFLSGVAIMLMHHEQQKTMHQSVPYTTQTTVRRWKEQR